MEKRSQYYLSDEVKEQLHGTFFEGRHDTQVGGEFRQWTERVKWVESRRGFRRFFSRLDMALKAVDFWMKDVDFNNITKAYTLARADIGKIGRH